MFTFNTVYLLTKHDLLESCYGGLANILMFVNKEGSWKNSAQKEISLIKIEIPVIWKRWTEIIGLIPGEQNLILVISEGKPPTI